MGKRDNKKILLYGMSIALILIMKPYKVQMQNLKNLLGRYESMRRKMRSMVWVVFMAVAMCLLIQGVYAQEKKDEKKDEKKTEEVKNTPAPEQGRRSGEGRREGGDRGQRRGFDPAMMQERMLGRIKESMGSTDEEWKAIEPMVKNVLDAQMKTRMGGFFRGREGSEAPGEVEALRNALESEQSKPEEIKQKLEAYRNMRKKNEEELEKAQGKLKKVLTVKQEAQLVLMGTLK